MSQPLGGETQYTNPPQSLDEMLEWWEERMLWIGKQSERPFGEGPVEGPSFNLGRWEVAEELVSQLRRLLPPKLKTPEAQLSLTDPPDSKT